MASHRSARERGAVRRRRQTRPCAWPLEDRVVPRSCFRASPASRSANPASFTSATTAREIPASQSSLSPSSTWSRPVRASRAHCSMPAYSVRMAHPHFPACSVRSVRPLRCPASVQTRFSSWSPTVSFWHITARVALNHRSTTCRITPPSRRTCSTSRRASRLT